MSRIPVGRSPSNSKASQQKLHWLPGLIILVLGGIVVESWMDAYLYHRGEQAYGATNCTQAIAHYNQVIERNRVTDWQDFMARAEARIAECQAYQETVAQAESAPPALALLGHHDFVSRYRDGSLATDLRQQAANLLQTTDLTEVASVEVCDRLDSMHHSRLLPQPNEILPTFRYTCGQTYASDGRHTQAIEQYQQFLQAYPQHDLTLNVETALAKAMVAEAEDMGAGDIGRPPVIGYTATGETVVQIQNSSPEEVRIIFSGTEPRFVELPPCEDCQTYIGEGPELCPEQGPIEEYTLKPGDYDVLVRSISDRRVTPYTGDWQLEGGMQYGTCFFIVRQPTPGTQNE